MTIRRYKRLHIQYVGDKSDFLWRFGEEILK
jgi:hypothetical protein